VPDLGAGIVVGNHHLTGKAAIGWSMLKGLSAKNGSVPLDLYSCELQGNESFTAGQTKTDSFKRAFSRLLDDLSDYELITVSGDQLTLTDQKI
jgi:hypothetical protein